MHLADGSGIHPMENVSPDSCTVLVELFENSHCFIGFINILPTHTSGYDTQWLPSNFILLIHHQEVCGPWLWPQCLLPMLEGPFQPLSRNQDLAKAGINLRLSRVKTCYGGNQILIFEHVSRRRKTISQL